ncbi:MAG: tRNA ((37)-C2)-methylthiotransferase MiaB [Rickettsiaceae bacterium]|jgi:tRNA-2-methylthio-N6-dimethylallyladenosine synthase|nr:tRNA ((37)-C2)-methylthiotransferase MiaB [Rickettsiaceae bacterium]
MEKEINQQKKLYIKTYGCQMNSYDSDRMQDLMKAVGYQNVDAPDNADMVIINTCHIREKAAEKLYCDLGRIKKHKENLKKQGRQMIVAVAGCVGQAEGEEIFKRAPVTDIIVGPESYQTLPDLVGKVLRDKGGRQIDLDFKPDNKFDILKESQEKSQVSSFLSIQEGCDKFCTFCVVPYTRGAEFSRPVTQIYEEALSLAARGAAEIYLLGQNVNAYHGIDENGNNFNLAKLVRKIAEIPQIQRIRYTTSHPRDMDEELILAHRDIGKLMPFLHLPVQSGSNNVLKMMNRKHTRQDYFKIIDKLREARPDIGLSSDFIVGFPGETDQDFKDTLDLVEKVGFSQCYSFKYSPRPGTPAQNANDQIAEEVKDARLQELQTLLTKQQIAYNKEFEGRVMKVLFDRKPGAMGKKSAGQIIGKSPYLQSVVIDDSEQKYLGKLVDVKILKSRPSSLMGEVL